MSKIFLPESVSGCVLRLNTCGSRVAPLHVGKLCHLTSPIGINKDRHMLQFSQVRECNAHVARHSEITFKTSEFYKSIQDKCHSAPLLCSLWGRCMQWCNSAGAKLNDRNLKSVWNCFCREYNYRVASLVVLTNATHIRTSSTEKVDEMSSGQKCTDCASWWTHRWANI